MIKSGRGRHYMHRAVAYRYIQEPELRKIYFIHGGGAMYPLIKAMRIGYSHLFSIEECSFHDAAQKSDIAQAICWHMMGYYPSKLPAALTIHDYRSLSLGRFGWFKDRLKEMRNAKPDVRIIQPSIHSKMKFGDNVKTFLLDVAISDEILDFRFDPITAIEHTFCYIGSMKPERKLEVMIDSFLRNRPKTETLALVGHVERYLEQRYSNHRNILFTGPLSQRDAFHLVQKSSVAVSYFPEHFPHIYQTPTKLLEYAAIGSRILANRQTMNVIKANQYGINAVWRDTPDMFVNLPSQNEWADNSKIQVKPMMFRSHMQSSGVEEFLLGLIGRADP